MDVTDANIKLCRAVELYPIIYDPKAKFSASRLHAAWNKIAFHCNDTPANCKQRWGNIRTAFTRASYGTKKRSANRNHDYYLRDVLKFLEPHIWNFTDLDKLSAGEDNPTSPHVTADAVDTAENEKNDKSKNTTQQALSHVSNDMNNLPNDETTTTITTTAATATATTLEDIEHNLDTIKTFIIKQSRNELTQSPGSKQDAAAEGLQSSNLSHADTTFKKKMNNLVDPLEQPVRVLRTSKRTLDKSLELRSSAGDAASNAKQKDLRNKITIVKQPESKRRRPASNSRSPSKHERYSGANESDTNSSASTSSARQSRTGKYELRQQQDSSAPSAAIDENEAQIEISAQRNESIVVETLPSNASANAAPAAQDLPDYCEELLLLAEEKAKEHEAEELLKLKAPPTTESAIQCKVQMDCLDTDFMEDIKRYMLEMNGRQKLQFKHKVYKSLADVFDSAFDFPNAGQVIAINDKEAQQIEQKLQPPELNLIRELAAIVLAAKKSTELLKSNTTTAELTQKQPSTHTLGQGNVRRVGANNGAQVSNQSAQMKLYLPSGKVYRCGPTIKPTAVVSTTTTALRAATPVTSVANGTNKSLNIISGKIIPANVGTITSVASSSSFVNSVAAGGGSGSGGAAGGANVAASTVASSIATNIAGSGVGGGSELNLPSELLNEAIKISENGGGSITATDGNKRRIYRIYPKGSGSTSNINPARSSTSGTFIIPQVAALAQSTAVTPSAGAMHTTTSAAMSSVINSTVSAGNGARPITISARPVVLNAAQSFNGSLTTPSPIKLQKSDQLTPTNDDAQSSVELEPMSEETARFITAVRRTLKETQFTPPSSLPAMQYISSLQQAAIQQTNKPVRPPQRRYSLCSPQSLSSHENTSQTLANAAAAVRRFNEPVVTFKRSRYPHVAQGNNNATPAQSPVRSITPSSPIHPAAAAATTTAVATTNANKTATLTRNGSLTTTVRTSLLKPLPAGMLRAGVTTTNTATTPTNIKNSNDYATVMEATLEQQESNFCVETADSTGLISADDFFVNIKEEPMDDEPEFPNLFG